MTARMPGAYVAVGLLMMVVGCSPDEAKVHYYPTTVTLPDPANPTNNGDWTKDDQGHMVIHIAFSRDIRRDTVSVTGTLILKTPRQPATVGSMVWKSDHELDFVTSQTYEWLIMTPTADTVVELTLHGTRSGPNSAQVITDTNGHPIDGDGDGVEGGNYTVRFGIPFF